MKTLLGLIFNRFVLLLLGAICVALLIWFAGPFVAFADWHPLESEKARLITIVVVFALWLGKRIVQQLQRALTNRKMLDSLSGKGKAPAAGEAADPQLELVRSRFAQAMEVIKSTRAGATAKRSIWQRLFGGQRFVYQLPWYLFIGPPGSGKTTALLNSGLQFPLAERLGNDPVRGIGGTRNCDWWFTDQAVMIDTAGRYTTQDSDQQADSREWAEFLSGLRKYRPRQPINGALVTVSVADLLQLSSSERGRQAIAVRNRIQELLSTLDASFPIYLLVTKADLLAGFMEFFGDLEREQREQVWGTTFDYDPQRPVAPSPAQLDERMEELINGISAQTLDRLQAERDVSRRASIYGFAAQFAALKPALAAFVKEAFPASTLARQPLLRGVYFTSGTQEGNPIDRVMGSLGRQFGLQTQVLPPMRASGKAFFLSRLLHGVIFTEAPLAGTNLRWERQIGTVKWTATLACSVIALAAILGWSISYINNLRYVDEVQSKADTIRKTIEQGVLKSDAKALLPLYGAVRNLARTEVVDPDHPGIAYSLGLFQGHKLDEAANQSYRRLLGQSLAPALASRMAAVLGQSFANPDLQYETLKRYVMLRSPEHLNAASLKAWVEFDLENNLAASFNESERRELLAHVDELLAHDGLIENAVPDDALIARARAALASTPFAQRVYNRIKRQGLGKDFPAFRIDNMGGPSATLIFARQSGRPLSEGVPGFYTYDGYHGGLRPAIDGVLKDLAAEEVWVLGIKDSEVAKRAATLKGRESLGDEVKRLYLLEYAATWEKFVADITLQRGGGLTRTIETARVLSGANSPLKQLLTAIVREVSLSEVSNPSAADKVAGKANEVVQETKDQLKKMLGANAPAIVAAPAAVSVEKIVDNRFDELRRFVRSPTPGGPAPVDQTIALLNEFYSMMNAVQTALQAGTQPPPSEVPNKIKTDSGRLPEPVRSMMRGLASGGANQALAETRVQIGQNLATSVADFCRGATGNRYPFAPDSKNDVTPDDFVRLFAPGGLLDDFFQKNLAQHVDTSVKPWRFRKIGDATMGDSASLIQFQRAADIRNVFFGGGAKGLSMKIEFKPIEMDPAVLQFSLDIDGQVLKYAHGPIVPQTMTWPGPRGSNQIRMQISPPGPTGSTGLVFEGAWALFRMFERAQLEGAGTPEKFRAAFTVDTRRILFDVTTSSVQNPFRFPELQAFRCPSQL